MSVKPESMGMCSTRLLRYVDNGRLPCALLQVARGGQLEHQTVLGKASLESGAPLDEDSLVRICSMTKPITSVAFMMLVEEGLVALDDPVHRFIPSWRNLGVYVGGGSGGLPGTPPGWLPFERFLRTRIFDPLGMHDTAFFVDPAKASRLAQCYLTSSEGKLVPAQLGSFSEPPSAPSGGGGLVSTAADYMRFCEGLRRGGELDGTRLLGPKTLALMRANNLPGGKDLADVSLSMFTEATYRGVGFGLGFAMTTDVAKTQLAGSVGEYWRGGAASTAFWIDPVEELCVVFLTQFLPSTLYPIRRELRTLVNAAVIDSRA